MEILAERGFEIWPRTRTEECRCSFRVGRCHCGSCYVVIRCRGDLEPCREPVGRMPRGHVDYGIPVQQAEYGRQEPACVWIERLAVDNQVVGGGVESGGNP